MHFKQEPVEIPSEFARSGVNQRGSMGQYGLIDYIHTSNVLVVLFAPSLDVERLRKQIECLEGPMLPFRITTTQSHVE